MAATAGEVALAAIAAQRDTLLRTDPAVHADAPDAVHQMRVAVRTLRSLLATYRPVLLRSHTDGLRGELSWVGGVLGGARDVEVVRAHCAALLAEQPPQLVLGPVGQRLQDTLAERYRGAHREVVLTLDSDRWRQLVDDLDLLLTEPLVAELAAGPARRVVARCVRKDFTRVRRAAARARHAETTEDRVVALHEVRKATKRLRYAAESAASVHGKAARRTARAAKAVQEALGEHQDAAVTRQLLRDIADAAHRAGEPSFTYGRLDALVQARTADVEARYHQAWAELRRHRRWLRA